MGSFSFQLISIVYTVLLIIIFFSKERINKLENKIYISLVVVTFLTLVLDVSSVYFGIFYPYLTFSNILCKLYLLGILAWVIDFTYYIFVISSRKLTDVKDNKNYFKKFKDIFAFVFFVSSVIVFALPLEIFSDGKMMYTFGPSASVSYAVSGLCLFIWIICILKNTKKIRDKKYYPVYAFVVFAGGSIVIQKIYPEILLVTSAAAFITFLTFFTIENPDVKMIEQLNMAKEQADKANRAKTDFLSSMSHEIRTPLNAIVGFSECIVQANDLDEAKENASDIVGASKTLLEIVNGILDISKIEAGKLEIHNSSYNSSELFDSIIKLAKGRLGDKDLDFRINIAEDIPETLYGDHSNLKKVIINLLTNAIKYTDHGYFELKINCVKTNDICRLMISVEDSGRGIKQENLDRLFTKFQRLEEDMNTTIEGTGLGLAITKQLVELMGGTIVVQSTFGEGSKFSVALDQKITNDVVKKEVVEEKIIDLSDKKILIVDDNNLNLKVASKIIAKYNPTIETANSGMECIEKIDAGNTYDLILLDDMMPRMSGGETLARLKQKENFNIPVVALTANALTGMEEKYISQGFNDYLAKPIEKDKLYKVLVKYLSNKEEPKFSSEEKIVVKEEKIEVEEEKVEDKPVINSQGELDLTGKKILIVDDNKLNIKVASLLLKPYNPTITEALSGDECIEKVKSETFDLIFMDDMMPKKSGVETYHELEKLENFNTPVVALTANALTGMREQYLEEGFDEYISKPINKSLLNDVLIYIFNNYKPNTNIEKNILKSNDEEKSNNSIDYLKSNGVNIDNGIALLGSIEMYDETLNDFFDNLESRVMKIRNLLINNDLENYAIEVHSLKSDSKYLGFTSLADISYKHEMASKEKNKELVMNSFNSLLNELNKVYKITKNYLGK